MARPTKFTRETVEKLLRAIRMGAPYELACAHAGIHYDTFNEWQQGRFPRGLDEDQKLLKSEFSELLMRAQGDSSVRALSTIQQAMAQGNADIALKLLERRWPEHFGVRRMEITGKDGGPVQIEARAAKLIEAEAKSLGIEGADVDELQQAFIDYINSQDGDDE